jgi:myo-inositol-hexaphosphate 3-phosphohydrolase
LNPLIGQVALNLVLSSENPTAVIGMQETLLDEVQIFPNPTHNLLSVSVPKNLNDAVIKVYDLSGKELIQMYSDEAIQVFDVSKLNSGVYFLKITTQEGERTLRFEVH